MISFFLFEKKIKPIRDRCEKTWQIFSNFRYFLDDLVGKGSHRDWTEIISDHQVFYFNSKEWGIYRFNKYRILEKKPFHGQKKSDIFIAKVARWYESYLVFFPLRKNCTDQYSIKSVKNHIFSPNCCIFTAIILNFNFFQENWLRKNSIFAYFNW